MAGETISHYRVLEKLRAGRMGVVYRAEDIKLGCKITSSSCRLSLSATSSPLNAGNPIHFILLPMDIRWLWDQ